MTGDRVRQTFSFVAGIFSQFGDIQEEMMGVVNCAVCARFMEKKLCTCRQHRIKNYFFRICCVKAQINVEKLQTGVKF